MATGQRPTPAISSIGIRSEAVLRKVATGAGTEERGLDYRMTGGKVRVSKDGDWSETYACNLFDWHQIGSCASQSCYRRWDRRTRPRLPHDRWQGPRLQRWRLVRDLRLQSLRLASDRKLCFAKLLPALGPKNAASITA